MRSKKSLSGLIKSINVKRLIAICAPCIAVTLALVILLSGSGIVSAAVSLPYIEDLASQIRGPGGSFTILEIVPNMATARFGYYIEGEERDDAGRNWETHVGTLSGADRKTYVDGLQSRLNSAGVLSDPSGLDAPPITWLADYEEYKPWNAPSDTKTLELGSFEEPELVSGTITESPSGLYEAESEFIPYTTGEQYMLDIRQLTYDYDGSAQYYFGSVVFRALEWDMTGEGPSLSHMLYYENAGSRVYIDLNTPLYVVEDDHYTYFGSISGGFEYTGDLPEVYMVSDYGAVTPADETEDSVVYYAVTSPAVATDASFRRVSELTNPALGARFTRDITSLTYLGTNTGTHNFAFDATGAQPGITINYNIVHYRGGFSNNNWFLRHVFDREISELAGFAGRINVNTVPSDNLTAAHIAGANLIYISGSVTSMDPGIAGAILNRAIDELTPVMFGYGLTNTAGTVRTLAQNLAAKSSSGGAIASTAGVNENVFWTESDRNLNQMLIPRYYGSSYNSMTATNPFYDVKNDIDYENFLRAQDVTSPAPIPEVISDATALRHIINFANRRNLNKLDIIRVLEIQPGAVNETSYGTQHNGSDINDTVVRTWASADSSIPVVITRVSMYEFVGRIEDLNECYDIIYIGGSSVKINQSNTSTTNHNAAITYNDTNMNGLLYTNIGDRYRIDSAPSNGTQAAATMALLTSYPEASDTYYRLSGNDITSVKMDDLRDFVSSGYPIILDSRIADGSRSSGTVTINSNRVDNSSKMWKLLDDIKDRENVFTTADSTNPNIARYASLSKPKINLTYQPPSYTTIAGPILGVTTDNNVLRFDFTITNDTDATPTLTTYDVGLYLDINGDGRYKDDEILNDIVVRDVATNTVLSRVGGVYQLGTGRTYRVTRQMPESAVGLYAWNLRVSKNGTGGSVRASVTDYTRIAPDGDEGKKTINVLQITSSQTGLSWTAAQANNAIDLEVQQRTRSATNPQLRANNGNYYTGVYGKLLADVDDFDVRIITVLARELDNLNITKYTGSERPALRTHLSSRGLTLTSSLADIFNTFDMLIIGFDDCYGELSAASGAAIVSFINTEKAVLFTHDTTSFFNRNIGSNQWGINFNTQLRDAVKLDRYGISSAAYGSTVRSWNSTANEAVTAGRSTARSNLENDNYSIAYEPKSGTARMVRDTQGYTNYHMKSYATGTESSSYSRHFLGITQNFDNGNTYLNRTHEVTQVNKGKITTYPYNINITPEFNNGSYNTTIQRSNNNTAINVGSSTAGIAMRVPRTHEQYYQLNMNNEDIVVWYTLNSPYYAKNDVTNGYYIFNCGNITYSGAGHVQDGTGGQSNYTSTGNNSIGEMYINEAKLFVNTMIAAYRGGPENPTVRVTNPSGVGNVRYMLLPSDGEILTGLDDSARVYFNLSDANFNPGRTIELNISYETGDHRSNNPTAPLTGAGAVSIPHTSLEVYRQDDRAGVNELNNARRLQSGLTYWFNLPDAVVAILNSAGENQAVTVRLEVVTRIGSDRLYGYADVVIRRIELFPLG